jgi:hypothetical protein
LALTSAIGCVKDTDGSYCLAGQAEALNAAKIGPSTNLITILTSYAAVRFVQINSNFKIE